MDSHKLCTKFEVSSTSISYKFQVNALLYMYKFKSNPKNVPIEPPRCVPSFKSLNKYKFKKRNGTVDMYALGMLL